MQGVNTDVMQAKDNLDTDVMQAFADMNQLPGQIAMTIDIVAHPSWKDTKQRLDIVKEYGMERYVLKPEEVKEYGLNNNFGNKAFVADPTTLSSEKEIAKSAMYWLAYCTKPSEVSPVELHIESAFLVPKRTQKIPMQLLGSFNDTPLIFYDNSLHCPHPKPHVGGDDAIKLLERMKDVGMNILI